MVVVGKAAVRRRRGLEMTQRSERRDEDKRGMSHPVDDLIFRGYFR